MTKDELDKLQSLYDEAYKDGKGIFNNLVHPATSFERLRFEAIGALPDLIKAARSTEAKGPEIAAICELDGCAALRYDSRNAALEEAAALLERQANKQAEWEQHPKCETQGGSEFLYAAANTVRSLKRQSAPSGEQGGANG